VERVVVTGGASFMGSHPCERLLALAREVLGWRLEVDITDGLARTVEWFHEQVAVRAR
jgi:nucleoside-diphosphate-sugar epimerase